MKLYAIIGNLVFCLFICANVIESRGRLIGIIFLIILQICMIYEHGYKIFFKDGYRKIFYAIYIAPFLLTVFVVFAYFNKAL